MAGPSAKIEGMRQVLASFRSLSKAKKKGLRLGLGRAGLLLQRESQAIVPVEFGNLQASAFTRVEDQGPSTFVVTVGYTAEYAVYVHEILDYRHGQMYNDWHWMEIQAGTDFARGANQQAKFLEDPLRINLEDMKTQIRNEVEIAE